MYLVGRCLKLGCDVVIAATGLATEVHPLEHVYRRMYAEACGGRASTAPLRKPEATSVRPTTSPTLSATARPTRSFDRAVSARHAQGVVLASSRPERVVTPQVRISEATRTAKHTDLLLAVCRARMPMANAARLCLVSLRRRCARWPHTLASPGWILAGCTL